MMKLPRGTREEFAGYPAFSPHARWPQLHSTSGVFSMAWHCALQYFSCDSQVHGG